MILLVDKASVSNIIPSNYQSVLLRSHCTQDAPLKTVDDWQVSLDPGKCVNTFSLDVEYIKL